MVSNFFIGINAGSKQLIVIRAMSVVVIFFILFYNMDLMYSAAVILPLSIDKISYLSKINSTIHVDSEMNISMFKLSEMDRFACIKNLINSLDNESNYLLNIIFTPNSSFESADIPQMSLSEPILVNRYSSHTIITMFINERIDIMIDCYYLSDSILEEGIFTPSIIFHYWKIDF
jgi:hypothetical protein